MGEEGRIASRVGRIASNSQKFMAGASTYEQEVLHPGPTGRNYKIYATPAGKWREVRALARALTKERSRSLMSGQIIDSIVWKSGLTTGFAIEMKYTSHQKSYHTFHGNIIFRSKTLRTSNKIDHLSDNELVYTGVLEFYYFFPSLI